MTAAEQRALGLAIQTRLIVRAALDRDDMESVCKWNHVADAAYAVLSPMAAARYIEWCREEIDAMKLFARSDA